MRSDQCGKCACGKIVTQLPYPVRKVLFCNASDVFLVDAQKRDHRGQCQALIAVEKFLPLRDPVG